MPPARREEVVAHVRWLSCTPCCDRVPHNHARECCEPYDVAGVRNHFRNGRRHAVEIAHGLTADFQHALHRRSGFLVRQVLL